MIKWLCILLLATCTSLHAQQKPRHIIFDPGGELYQRYMDWRDVKRSGQSVILDGICLSGCVMFTTIIPEDRVCITPLAVVGVHSASDAHGKFTKEGTRLYWQTLSEPIRDAARRQGWNGETEHPDFIYISYNDLSKVYRECTATDLAEVYPDLTPAAD